MGDAYIHASNFVGWKGGAGKAELDGKGFMKLCEDWEAAGKDWRFDSWEILGSKGPKQWNREMKGYESVFSC